MIKKVMNALMGALVGGTLGLAVLAWAPGTVKAAPCPNPTQCASTFACEPSATYTYCQTLAGGVCYTSTGCRPA